MEAFPPTAPILRRPGDPSDTASDESSRASQDANENTEDLNIGDFGVPKWDEKIIRLAAHHEDRNKAIKHPLLGWRNSERLLRDTIGGVRLTHAVSDAEPYRHSGPRTSYAREARRDPVSVALCEADARHVDQREFCMLDGPGQAERPLTNSRFLTY